MEATIYTAKNPKVFMISGNSVEVKKHMPEASLGKLASYDSSACCIMPSLSVWVVLAERHHLSNHYLGKSDRLSRIVRHR